MRHRYAVLLALSVFPAIARGDEAVAAATTTTHQAPCRSRRRSVAPADVTLVGPDAVQRLLVTGAARDGRGVTSAARFLMK